MKILWIALSGVLLLVACTFVIGLLLPKKHTASRSALYHARPGQLYALISGPQSWRPDVSQYQVIEETESRQLVQETTRNKETILYETTNRVPSVSLRRSIASKNLPYSGTWNISLEPAGELTRIRITEDGEVGNPIFRFMARFVFGYTRTMDAYLRALGYAAREKVQTSE